MIKSISELNNINYVVRDENDDDGSYFELQLVHSHGLTILYIHDHDYRGYTRTKCIQGSINIHKYLIDKVKYLNLYDYRPDIDWMFEEVFLHFLFIIYSKEELDRIMPLYNIKFYTEIAEILLTRTYGSVSTK